MEKFNPNLYDILGRISTNATPEEIRQAYKAFAKIHHPDKNPNDKFAAEERMAELNTAYEILKDPVKRAEYNANLLKHNEALRKTADEKKRKEEADRLKKQTEEALKQTAQKRANAFKQNSTTSSKNNSLRKIQASETSAAGTLVGVALGVVALGLLIDALTDD